MRWLAVFLLCTGLAWGQSAHVAQGDLQGVKVGDCNEFKGIPYAAPPVGPLRWQPPKPPAPWDGVRDATRFAAVAMQPSPAWSDVPRWIGREDCLTLNVFAGVHATHAPVMVFMHGGSEIWGSGGQRLLDGRDLAEHGLVVVTFNYRLGPFGFIALPELSAESGHGSGNYAIMDAIAALRWVHDNIAAFGGDPDHVLLAGQSAGSVNVEALLMAPQARGLFSSALMMSGGGTGVRTLAVVEKSDSAWVAPLCEGVPSEDRLAHLRSIPAAELAAALRYRRDESSIQYGVVVDGKVVPDTYRTLLDRGEYGHVPVMIGSTRDEMANLLVNWNLLSPFGIDPEDYPQAMQQLMGKSIASRALPLYGLSDFLDPSDALISMRTDSAFTAPLRRLARGLVARSTAPVFRYIFAHPPATHASDLPYLFHNLPDTATDEDRRLSDAMVGYLLHFAATGDPNGDPLPFWHEYQLYDDNYLWLDEHPHMAKHYRQKYCNFWDEL